MVVEHWLGFRIAHDVFCWRSSSSQRHVCAGTVKSTKMVRTITVRRNYLHFIKKYQR